MSNGQGTISMWHFAIKCLNARRVDEEIYCEIHHLPKRILESQDDWIESLQKYESETKGGAFEACRTSAPTCCMILFRCCSMLLFVPLPPLWCHFVSAFQCTLESAIVFNMSVSMQKQQLFCTWQYEVENYQTLQKCALKYSFRTLAQPFGTGFAG